MQVNRVSFDGMKKNGRLGTKKAQAQTFGSASTIISKAGDAVDKFSKSSSGKKFLDVIQFDSLNMSFPILLFRLKNVIKPKLRELRMLS